MGYTAMRPINVLKNIKHIEFTPKLRKYLINLAIRVAIFITILVLYLFRKEVVLYFMTHPFSMGFTFSHLVWGIMMFIMVLHLFPNKLRSMARLKAEKHYFTPVKGYSEHKLLKYIMDENRKALTVLLCWVSLNAVFGILYLLHVLAASDLFMLTVFFFLSDYVCIIFFCPFQNAIMKNRCCVNCRIYDWGHFMIFTPMLFIKGFFSWSLFFTSLIIMIRWEVAYTRYPQRFWSGSNKNLQCSSCKDKTCQIKKAISDGVRKKP